VKKKREKKYRKRKKKKGRRADPTSCGYGSQEPYEKKMKKKNADKRGKGGRG